MAILAANLVSKLSFRPHSQSLLFPGTKRSAAILCLKRRGHSTSSVPTRYIPKKTSSKVDEHQYTCSTLDGISGRNLDVARREIIGSEVNINHDTEFMNCEPVEEPNMVAEDVEIQHKRHIFNEKVPEDKTMLDAERMAIGFLAKRAFTAAELAKKLNAKKVPPNVVGALINDFRSRGLINDSLYAESFSESRWSSSSWGPKLIKQALFKKGVSEVDANKAVKSVFEEVESAGEVSKLGMSKVAMDRLVVQTTKQWLKSENAPIEKRKSRIIR